MVCKNTVLSFFALLSVALAIPARPQPPSEDMRLVKVSEDDAGTWVTEEEKFERFISKNIGFADVTETWDLEKMGSETRMSKRQAQFPAAPSHQAEVMALIPQLTTSTIASWMTPFTTFHTRYYRSTTGRQSSDWLFETVKGVAAANSRITVSTVTHSFTQRSIIARIPGRNSKVIIASAHQDSVGSSTTGRSPGADDDASGSFTILETLRVLANSGFAPTNTVEFHWYAGEEGGLLGSRDVMRDYAARGVNVAALLNQDMTGYSPNNVMAVIQDFVNAPLSAFVAKLIPAYTNIPGVTSLCGYGCSDHASATAVGYPAAFVFEDRFEDSSPYIHSSGDTVARLNYPHILEHAKMTLGFVIEGSYF